MSALSGADRLLRFYLEDPDCSYESFARWWRQDDGGVVVAERRPPSASHSSQLRLRGSSSSRPATPATPPDGEEPGRPPDELSAFRPELGLALANFVRDQAAG